MFTSEHSDFKVFLEVMEHYIIIYKICARNDQQYMLNINLIDNFHKKIKEVHYALSKILIFS